jgi:hypothetical protein
MVASMRATQIMETIFRFLTKGSSLYLGHENSFFVPCFDAPKNASAYLAIAKYKLAQSNRFGKYLKQKK